MLSSSASSHINPSPDPQAIKQVSPAPFDPLALYEPDILGQEFAHCDFRSKDRRDLHFRHQSVMIQNWRNVVPLKEGSSTNGVFKGLSPVRDFEARNMRSIEVGQMVICVAAVGFLSAFLFYLVSTLRF